MAQALIVIALFVVGGIANDMWAENATFAVAFEKWATVAYWQFFLALALWINGAFKGKA